MGRHVQTSFASSLEQQENTMVASNHDGIFHKNNEIVSGGLKCRVLPLFFFLCVIIAIWVFILSNCGLFTSAWSANIAFLPIKDQK
jgi:hypothetical protein